jgi:prepilin-type N-terminal cleavage/methylation domain-containing protein
VGSRRADHPGMRALRRRIAACPSESGFTLIEVVVALTVLLVAFTMVAVAYPAAYKAFATSRERQDASQLANQAMEQLRGLPYATVTGGQRDGDLDADMSNAKLDPKLVFKSGGKYHLFSTSGEVIPAGKTGQLPTPLEPAAHPITEHKVDFRVRAYVTEANESTVNAKHVYRLTVAVYWVSTSQHSARKHLVSQSLLSRDNGCGHSQTHPFLAPCQAFLDAQISTGNGYFNIGSNQDVSDGKKLPGVELPQARKTLQLEQTDKVTGNVSTAGIQPADPSADGPAPQLSVTNTATSDPASSAPRTSSDPTGARKGGSLDWSGTRDRDNTHPDKEKDEGENGTVSFAAGADGGDVGTALSTVAAASSPTCAGPDGKGAEPGKPCGAGASAVGDARLADYIGHDSGWGGAVDLVHLADGVSTSAFATRSDGGGNLCATSDSNVGCIDAVAHRGIGALNLGQLPPTLDCHATTDPNGGCYSQSPPTTACDYLIKIDPVDETVRAQGGPGVDAPTASRDGHPKIHFCDDSGTTSVSLDDPDAQSKIPDKLSVTRLLEFGTNTGTYLPLTVTMTPHLHLGGASTTKQGTDCANGCRASAQLASPVSGSFEYVATYNQGVLLTDVVAHVDFGTLKASTNYRSQDDS